MNGGTKIEKDKKQTKTKKTQDDRINRKKSLMNQNSHLHTILYSKTRVQTVYGVKTENLHSESEG